MDTLIIFTLLGFIIALLVVVYVLSVELKLYKDEVEAYNKNQADLFEARFRDYV